jgi:membrane-associated phospholipid phosphatase
MHCEFMLTKQTLLKQLFTFVLATLSCSAYAADGPFGIDTKNTKSDSAIWKQSTQNGVLGLVIIGEVATALWEGNKSEAGRTSWAAMDSLLVAGVSVEILKRVFRRVRPRDTDNPNLFFDNKGNDSFPSGQTTLMTAAITPLILRNKNETPAVWALAALPLYTAVARVKTQDHWPSDVIAGIALGAAAGYLASETREAITLDLLPGGFSVGLKYQFK